MPLSEGCSDHTPVRGKGSRRTAGAAVGLDDAERERETVENPSKPSWGEDQLPEVIGQAGVIPPTRLHNGNISELVNSRANAT
jgi:hypothetical protein